MRHALWVGLAASMSIASTARAAEDLTIESAVTLALSRNERAKIADLNVVFAEAGVMKARTAFLPTIIATGNYTQRPDDLVAAGKNSYAALGGVTVNQPLLNASAFPLYAQSKRLLDGQIAQTIDDKRLLAYDAARAFFSCLIADAVVGAANTRLDSAKANHTATQARAAAGIVSTNDVTRAAIDLANAIHEVENDKGNAQVAYVGLAFTINAPTPSHLVPPATILTGGRQAIPPVADLLKLAIAHRPDLVSKRQLAIGAHDFAAEPLLRLIPTIGLSGTFQLASDPTLPGHAFYNNEFITATLTWPLFDAGVRYADKRARNASASIADFTVDALVRGVDEQVRTAVYTLQAAQSSLGAAQQARDAAKQSADETAVLYNQGSIHALELVDANDTRFLADVSYAEAEYAVALGYLALRQALGLDPIGPDYR